MPEVGLTRAMSKQHSSCSLDSPRRGSTTRPIARAKPLAAAEMHFSLDQPPPVQISAAELLTNAASNMPSLIRCVNSEFEADVGSRGVCILTIHTFWYAFCALHQPESTETQLHLLRLMGQQLARLIFRLRSEKNLFFRHFPPLLAHAVLYGLRRHNALPKASASYARSLLRHLVALLGGYIPPHLLPHHFNYAERPPTVPGELISYTSRISDGSPTTLSPPLLLQHVPPMAGVTSWSRGAAALTSSQTEGSRTVDSSRFGTETSPHRRAADFRDDVSQGRAATSHRRCNSSHSQCKTSHSRCNTSHSRCVTSQLHLSSQSTPVISRDKPPRVRVDLKRQSPLIALFNGQVLW